MKTIHNSAANSCVCSGLLYIDPMTNQRCSYNSEQTFDFRNNVVPNSEKGHNLTTKRIDYEFKFWCLDNCVVGVGTRVLLQLVRAITLRLFCVSSAHDKTN